MKALPASISNDGFAQDSPTRGDRTPAITAALGPIFIRPEEGLFSKLAHQLEVNEENSNAKHMDNETCRTLLAGTPFEHVFNALVPFDIPMANLFEHTVLIAGAGHGKTQTLGAMLSHQLNQEDPPAMVVIDSTGALIEKIQHLAVFNDRLKHRILIIDPEHNPSLNMFDVSKPRLASYSQTVRESVETEIIALFNYVFTSAQNDLTSRQGTVFSDVVRLVLSMSDATIHTLRQVLEDKPKDGRYENSKYKPYIEKLDKTAQDFFKNQYFELTRFREQIAQRVYGLIQIPAFERMFTTSNTVDFYEELQVRGSIILVNTSERLLKENGSPLFGRYMRRDNQDENPYCLTQKCSRGQPVASARMLLASLSICAHLSRSSV